MNEKQAEQIINLLTNLVASVAGMREDFKKVTTPPAAQQVPDAIKKAAQMMAGIPKDVIESLGVVGAGADPHKPWFQLVVKGGEKTISVKLGDTDLRLRLRACSTGELLKETTCGYNALPKALLAIVE